MGLFGVAEGSGETLLEGLEAYLAFEIANGARLSIIMSNALPSAIDVMPLQSARCISSMKKKYLGNSVNLFNSNYMMNKI